MPPHLTPQLPTLSRIQVRSQADIDREEQERQQRLARALQLQHAEAVSAIAPPEPAPSAALEPQATGAEDGAFSTAPPKVGRNEPCPCGSGRKFKHCHGALQQANG